MFFILTKLIGIGVVIWFSMTGKAQGEYWLRWAIIGLIGYWLAWVGLYATLSIPFLPTLGALVVALLIRKKLIYDAQKSKEATS